MWFLFACSFMPGFTVFFLFTLRGADCSDLSVSDSSCPSDNLVVTSQKLEVKHTLMENIGYFAGFLMPTLNLLEDYYT